MTGSPSKVQLPARAPNGQPSMHFWPQPTHSAEFRSKEDHNYPVLSDTDVRCAAACRSLWCGHGGLDNARHPQARQQDAQAGECHPTQAQLRVPCSSH
jgi:hypothetical protein